MTITSDPRALKIKEGKELKDWSNKDFLIYYSNRQKEFNGQELRIPPAAWMGFFSRMKGFREKLNVDNIAYKKFIDDIFDIFYKKGYTPAFGSIVSIKLYAIVGSFRTKEYDNEQFEQIKKDLFENDELFKKIAAAVADVVI